MNCVTTFLPDVVFFVTDGHLKLGQNTLSQISKRVQWTQDAYFNIPQEMLPIGGVMMFSNMYNVNQVKSEYESHFLAPSVDYSCYEPKGERYISVSFIGSNLNRKYPLSILREELIQYMHENHYAVSGNGWRYSGYLQPNQEPFCYGHSKIGINLSHFEYERYSSDRIYKIMGCGAMCLSHYYSGIERDFSIGEHLDVWHDLKELDEKIKHYLNHEDELKKIAEAGMKHVIESHSWKNRAEQLYEIVNNYVKN